MLLEDSFFLSSTLRKSLKAIKYSPSAEAFVLWISANLHYCSHSFLWAYKELVNMKYSQNKELPNVKKTRWCTNTHKCSSLSKHFPSTWQAIFISNQIFNMKCYTVFSLNIWTHFLKSKHSCPLEAGNQYWFLMLQKLIFFKPN